MPEDDGDIALIFGNYEVLRGSGGKPVELGRGGFGCTYRARHRFLGKEVALKVIHERLAGEESAKRRFLKEAREHSALEHPGIARLTDFGEAEGTFFYAMELCAGGDLKEYVNQRGPLPPDEALGLIRQTAEALRFAHARGIMHLDIKPSNLLLVSSSEGSPVVKLIDFGLVKRLVKTNADETMDPLAASLWSATFASPEQIMEQPLDERTDIFSLGMTAWFLMEGGGPVNGAPMQIVQERLSTASYEPRLPASLTGARRRVVARMLERDPQQRYRTCAELLAALDGACGQPEEQEEVPAFASVITPSGPLTHLADRFLLETAESESVFTGRDGERQLGVRVTLLDDRHVAEVQATLRRFPAAPPLGLAPVLEMTEFMEGWAVVEQHFSGAVMEEALRRSGPVALPVIAPLLHDAAAAMDAAASCGAAPHSLEQAVLEGVAGEGAVDWRAAQIRVALSITAPSSPAAEYTAASVSPSPLQAFASLLYFVTGGRRIPEKALFSAIAYIPIPGLGNSANRMLAVFLAGESLPADCRSLLLAIIKEEGLSSNCIHRREQRSDEGSPVTGVSAAAPSPLPVVVARVVSSSPPSKAVHRPRPGSRPKRTAAKPVLLGAAALVALGFGGWLFIRKKPEANKAAKAEAIPNTPAAATKDTPYINSLGMKFVPVPGTQVLFCIHETRSRDFAAFIADKNRGYTISDRDAEDWRTWMHKKTVPVGRGVGEKAEDSMHPAASVSWLDATAFCEWLSKKEGKNYRLPTDHEWSIAAGLANESAGTPKELDLPGMPDVYPWDGKLTASAVSGNYYDAEATAKFGGASDALEGYRDGFATTAPVMSFRANRYGLYDLGGNLSEWCAGCYDGTDPLGKDKILTAPRVLRGGSWMDHDPAHLLSSNRVRDIPGIRNPRVGFRCVMAATGP